MYNGIRSCSNCFSQIVFWPGQRRQNSPMFKDEIFYSALKHYVLYSEAHPFLCDHCIEEYLGRPLEQKDLRNCTLTWSYMMERKARKYQQSFTSENCRPLKLKRGIKK